MNSRARISVKRLIIAAASARPFVRAAVAAGFEVVAADVFCDADTRRDASQAIQLGYTLGGFEAEEIRREIFPLLAHEPTTAGQTAFVYGSGFETQPGLLEEIAQRGQVLGNPAETVRIAKDPDRFFSLLHALDIPFPETAFLPPASADGWLTKRVGGSGGTHVRSGVHGDGADHYYQRRVPGQPYSLLFLADGQQVRVVGYNEQMSAPSPEMPCRYGGAVSQASLPQALRAGMRDAALRITSAIGLRGLNSLDCMVDGERFWVLEVNPRLSATFALYDAAAGGARLLQAHLRACAGDLALALPPEQAQAHLIYYAPCDLTIPPGMIWPEWVADVPSGASYIKADEPLCTVMAASGDAHEAKALAQLRVTQLAQRIYQLRNE